MNEYVIVFCYGIAIVGATMAGGYLPRVMKLDHVRMQMVLSFVGGMMLGVALLILLPHGFLAIFRSADEPIAGVAIHSTVNAVLFGLLLTFFMMRAFHFHHHGEDHELEGHEDHHPIHHHADTPKTKLGWIGVSFGLGLHTFMDGMALGTAVIQDGLVASFGVFLAVLLHKPLDALSLSTVMLKENFSWPTIQAANAVFGLMCLAGAMLTLYLSEANVSPFWLGCLMAAAAGVFLCISLSDLLPEVQFHQHDRIRLSLAVVSGISVAFLIERFHTHF